ncbi:replication protein [Salinisphaera sp. SWV1]|uniref:replication protein n=1 Tax=Salinisphaera sp. SWV1 TaxID=3454139 RepID=UPI003F82ED7D
MSEPGDLPQLENGYTRIANQLFDAILQYGFSKRQLYVMLAIIRKTYGFNKVEDDITVTQLATMCSLRRSHVSEALAELVSIGAVLKRDGRYGYLLKIQKDNSRWARPKTGHVPKKDGERPKTGNSPSQNGTHKRQPQKTTPKDNPLYPPDGLPARVDSQLWADFVNHRKAIKKPMTDEAQRRLVRKLERMDGAGHDVSQALESSIINGWQGVFEPNETRSNSNGTGNPGHNRERPQSAKNGFWNRRQGQAFDHG